MVKKYYPGETKQQRKIRKAREKATGVKEPVNTTKVEKPTEQPVQSPTNSAINISTGSIDSNNIELQINEKDFNGNFKRVDVSIFIPTNGKVIVRDYAKDTANQTIVGLSNYGP